MHHAGTENLRGCKEVGGVKKGTAPEFTQVLAVSE